jgi:hypothetical protein
MNNLKDLIDDLNHKQLTQLLNYLASLDPSFRANIKRWRQHTVVQIDGETTNPDVDITFVDTTLKREYK